MATVKKTTKKVVKNKVEKIEESDVCSSCEGRGRSPLYQVYKECPDCKGVGKK